MDFDKENNEKKWSGMKKKIRDKGRELIACWEEKYFIVLVVGMLLKSFKNINQLNYN